MTNLYLIAQIFALVGMHGLLFQLISGSRWRWLERIIGFDKLTRIHKWTGLLGLSCILIHATLLMIYFGSFGRDVLVSFITPGWRWETLGMVSLDVMVVIVLLTIFYRRLHLPYHWWKRIHQLIYLGVLGGFIHSLFLGSHLVSGWLRWYWFSLGAIGLISFLHRRFIKHYPHRVVAHETIAANVHHVTLEPASGNKLLHQPGQFVFVQFQAKGISTEWHPFTVSSAPSAAQLTLSMKESGDWTKTLVNLPIGARAKIEGPYGQFSYTSLPADDLGYVFVAGGIGITPLHAMITELLIQGSQRTITLLYSARSAADFAFKTEFDRLSQQHPNLKLVYVTGRIDEVCITQAITSIPQQHYFVCGPKPMMTAIRQTLGRLGVPANQIHFEEFALN